jgi:hypothetical protein
MVKCSQKAGCFEITAKMLKEKYKIMVKYEDHYRGSNLLITLHPFKEFWTEEVLYKMGLAISLSELNMFEHTVPVYKYSFKERALGNDPMILDRKATRVKIENNKLKRLGNMVAWEFEESKDIDFTGSAICYLKEWVMYKIKTDKTLFEQIIGVKNERAF